MGLEEDIKIIMTAEDKASEEVQAAAKRINDEFRKTENVSRAVGRATQLNNQELFATARVMTSIGRVADRVTDIYTKYNVLQIRLQDSARNLADAQEDLRLAMLQSGPGSEDAVRAARRVQEAQEAQTRAAQESKLAMAGFGLEAVMTAGMMIQSIPNIKKWWAEMRGGKSLIVPSVAGAVAVAASIPMANHFSQPGDQTGIVGALNAISPGAGDASNDAIANFINTISEALGFGRVAATSAELRQQVNNITINGTDPSTVVDELGEELSRLQVGR